MEDQTSAELVEGLYESLVTEGLERTLATASLTADIAPVDPADEVEVLTRHVTRELRRALSSTKDPAGRLRLVNSLLTRLSQVDADTVVPPSRQLTRLATSAGPSRPARAWTRPRIPLSDAALLTNGHEEPSLAGEFRAEIDSSDEIDLLCAFIKWHGLRLLEPALSDARDRGAPLRVITTTYVGATDADALDRLVRSFGAEVKVQYDALRTRLHAKAWFFRRRTGFQTAYVGSSNLSRSALLDGV